MKKIVFGLAGLILLSAIGFNIYQHQRNKKLFENTVPDTVAKKESEASRMDDMAGENTSGPAADKKDISKLEEKLDATEEELDKAGEQLADELAKKDAFKEAQAQLQNRITSDPSFRERMKKIRLESIDSDYALLYEHLDLTPEQREEFKRIVGEWRVDDTDNSVPLILAATTDEEKEEARRVRQLHREKYKEQFIELMGEEKYNIYNDFRMSRFDRSTLDRFVQTLPAENRIDNNLMYNIIGRMSKERTALEKKYGFYDRISFPSDNRADTADNEAEMAEQVYDKYIEIGNEMLPPGQAEQYKAYIAQEEKRYLSQIKMESF